MAGFYKTNCIELRKIMAEKEIDTITELSKRSNISRNTITEVLKGSKQPSAPVMRKLIGTLEMQPEQAGRIFFGANLRSREVLGEKQELQLN